MPNPLLTATMIVRDEASHLSACLESIRDVVDEIVVVDTGSTDATVSIARSFGARVHNHPWRESFAEARNAGLELARGRWILYIDADERLRAIAPELVRSTLERATEVALRVRLRPFAGATPYWEYRIWRAHPRIRFAGVMHEKVTPSISALVIEERMTVGESGLFIDHVGYDGDQTHKHERNLPLLRAQLSADPTSSYNWSHLGEVLEGLGDVGQSEAAFEQAVQIARDDGGSPGALAFVELIRQRGERGHDVTALLDEALSRYPDNVALAWQRACAEIEAGRYEQGLRWLERFDADTDTEMPVEDTVAYPAELFGSRAPKARGLCLFKLARYREAATAYRQAEEFAPAEQAPRLMRALSERRAQERAGDAVPGGTGSEHGHRWAARELLAGLVLELGGVPVGLSATDATRAGAIRSVFGRMAPSAVEPVVRLAFGSHRLPPPDRPADERQGDVELWHDDCALSVAYGPAVGGSVRSGQGALGGYAPNLTRVFSHVAPFMLASLLGPYGRFALHGGAIQREGRAVLVLGDSGLGKSTLIFGALEDGWEVLSDDLVVIRSQASGPEVSGIPKGLFVPGEILADRAPSSLPRRDSRGRLQVRFEGWDRASHPIEAVVVVGHGDRDDTAIEAITSAELMGLLLRAMLSRQPAIVRRYAPIAIALCERPACRLLHARVPETRAAQAAQALAAHLRGVRC